MATALVVSPTRLDIDRANFPDGKRLTFFGWLPDDARELDESLFEKVVRAYNGHIEVVREKGRVLLMRIAEVRTCADIERETQKMVDTIKQYLDYTSGCF